MLKRRIYTTYINKLEYVKEIRDKIILTLVYSCLTVTNLIILAVS